MRRTVGVVAGAVLFLALTCNEQAIAGFFSYPKALQLQVTRISFGAPMLAPMAHARFCVEYPADCAAHRTIFRGGALKLNERIFSDLTAVNTRVNRAIVPQANQDGLAGEKWLVSPAFGDCNDYAVTKRHELLRRGWPSRALLLAEVATSSGEHHLVLVARTDRGDFVLDNLNANVRPFQQVRYHWVKIQSPSNPLYWAKVGTDPVYAEARNVSLKAPAQARGRLFRWAMPRPRVMAARVLTLGAVSAESANASRETNKTAAPAAAG